MRVRPGRNLIRILAGLLAASLLVFVTPAIVVMAVPILGVLLALAVWDGIRTRRLLADLTVTRRLPGIAGRDLPFAVTWQLERSSSVPMSGELRDCLPRESNPVIHQENFQFATSETNIELKTSLRIPVRGEFQFGAVWLRLHGRLGLIEVQKSFEAIGSIRIFPEIYHSPEQLEKDPGSEIVLLDKMTKARQHGVGTEFESLNEFREGDDPRRIDWRTTARVRHLVVRRFQVERHRDVMILVDCGRLMGAETERGTKLDCAIDAALMLARTAFEGGDRCGVALFDDEVIGYLPPQSGMASMNAISSCVYSANTRWHESDFSRMFETLQQRQSKRSMIIILSDIVDAETTQRFRASLATLVKRHVILFAALQTPALQLVTTSPVSESDDATRKAVAYQLLRERARALHSVARSGVNILDVTPDRLTVPLINQFIELRQKSLI
jgi:uncharacterized protein (DUF58 family)